MNKFIIITLISLISYIQPSFGKGTLCHSRVPGECSSLELSLSELITPQKEPAQYYDEYGIPMTCIGPGENEKVAPEFLGEACSATKQIFDKYVCQTGGEEGIEVYFEFSETTNVTLFGFGNIFFNVLSKMDHQSLPQTFGIINSQAKKGEAVKIVLSTFDVLQELTTFPNWLSIYYKGDSMATEQFLSCQKEY